MPKTMHNSILNLTSATVSMVSGFVAAVIVARLLGAEGVGVTAFGFWMASCAAAIADRGYPQSLLRNAAAEKNDASRQALVMSSFRAFASLILFVFLGAVLFVGIAGTFSNKVEISVWVATAVLFVAYCLANFATSASRGLGDFARPARNTVIGSLLFIPLSAIGAIFAGPAGAILALATRYIPQAAGIIAFLRVNVVKAEPLSTEFHRYRRQMWLNDMISILAHSRLEYLFLLLLATTSDMGHFAVAIAFAGLVEQLALQLSSPLVVSFSSQMSDDRVKPDVTHTAFLYVALIFLPISLGGAAIAPVLVPMVYGWEFAITGNAAAIMLLAGGLSAFSIVPWTFLAASGHASTLTRVMIVSALLTSIASPLAILIDGTKGLAVARVMTEFAALTILLYYSWRKEKSTPPVSLLIRVALSALLCSLAAFAIINTIPSATGMLLSVLAGAVVYILALKLSKAIPRTALQQLLAYLEQRQDNAAAHRAHQSLLWISVP